MSDLRDLMIIAGTEFVMEYGIDKISMRKIATSCNVSHAAMYRHFGNKDDYVREITLSVSGKLGKYLMRGIETYGKSNEKLIRMGINFVKFSVEYPNYYELLFLSKHVIPTMDADGKLLKPDRVEASNTFRDEVYRFLRENKIEENQDIIIVQIWSFIFGLTMAVRSEDLSVSDKFLDRVIRDVTERYSK